MAPTKSPREQIEELIHHYADAVCVRNGEQWGATWAEDARWVLGPGRDVAGREAIVALWNKAMATFSSVVQNVLNGAVDIDESAGTATGRWYIIEHFKRSDGVPGMLLAYYDDTYVRIGNRWHFASRELVRQYAGPTDLSGEFFFVF